MITKRKKRANELKDEYDYNSSLNNEENKANINWLVFKNWNK